MARFAAYNRYLAFALLLVLGGFLAFQALHGFERHHDHSGARACTEHNDGQGTHLHDSRYGSDDCSLCAFCLKATDLPALPYLTVPLGAFADKRIETHEAPCVKTACDTTSLRGPPAI